MYFDQDVHRVFPLMNLLLIGPSGIGKSTALRDMAEKNLIRSLPKELQPLVITGKSTKEALHEDLMANPHSIILASELANFFSKEKYSEGMIPYITDLLDLSPTSVRTKSGGKRQTIEEPAVAIMGGSTKEWLQDQLPSTAAAGGFLPRFFIIKEDHKGQRVPDPNRAMSPRQRIKLEQERADVFGSFQYLVTSHVGLVDFDDYSASDVYGLWYQTYRADTGILSPFAARAGVHVLRMSLLLAVSCGRGAICASDVSAAIKLFDYSMAKLQEVIVPMSVQGKMLMKVMELIGEESMGIVQVKRSMRNYCGSQDVDRLLRDLIDSKDLVLVDGKLQRSTKY